MLNIVTAKPKTPFEEGLNSLLEQQRPVADAWATALRESGKARLETLGMPTRRQESWRFIDLTDVFKQVFSTTDDPATDVTELVKAHTYPECANSRLVFINGVYHAELSNMSGLPASAEVLSLNQAFQTRREQLEGVFVRDITDEADPFVALNTALLQEGLFIRVAAGQQVDTPVQLLFLNGIGATSAVLTAPRVLVSLEQGAKLTVVASHFTLDDSAILNTMVAEVNLAADAQLEWTSLQAGSPQSFSFCTLYGQQQQSSRLVLNSINLGGKITRNNLATNLLGEAATCQFNGLSVLGGTSQVFDHTEIDHQVSGCASEQITKNILDDFAVTEFDGTILIRPHAQQSDARQLNRNLLLSNDAKAYTRPQLRIDADDVKCAHGATVGQLNDEEIFYLTSRGLSQEMARSILTLGFAEELLDRISVAGVREHLDKLIRRQLAGETQEGGASPWVL